MMHRLIEHTSSSERATSHKLQAASLICQKPEACSLQPEAAVLTTVHRENAQKF
jgi:hypothetical protein